MSEIMNENNILELHGLKSWFYTEKGIAPAVDGVDLEIPKGKIIGLVGESGCGKSMTAKSIMGLLKYPGKIAGGSILFDGKDLTKFSDRELRGVCGKDISMIFQEPMTSLNPVLKTGNQVLEAVLTHNPGIGRKEGKRMVIEMLRKVGIPEAEKRYDSYPHELSGGLRQRVMIAMAMICKPKLLIADEPTTALDVTIEAQILRLMKHLRDDYGTSVLIITHNLGVVAEICDYIYVMYAGRIMEQGETFELFKNTVHPYTKGLLNSIPHIGSNPERLHTINGVVPNLLHLPKGCSFCNRCEEASEECRSSRCGLAQVAPGHKVRCFRYGSVEESLGEVDVPSELTVRERIMAVSDAQGSVQTSDREILLEAKGLTKEFQTVNKGVVVHAVTDVDLTIYKGECLALVGESGCGKSTLGRTLIKMLPATAGSVSFHGENITDLPEAKFRPIRRKMQMVFQDPYASLNPRMKVGDIIAEPLETYKVCATKAETRQKVIELMQAVGVPVEFINRYPHQFSGGQRQRIGIARAIALQPELIVCDEPVSALDVSVQSQVLNLMKDLQRDRQLTYLFIGHDLSVINYIADRVCVMFLGSVCEIAGKDELYRNPLHPYTGFLMDAIPIADPEKRDGHRKVLEGEIPSPVDLPSGCYFHTRCPYATEECRSVKPQLKDYGDGHMCACHHAGIGTER